MDSIHSSSCMGHKDAARLSKAREGLGKSQVGKSLKPKPNLSYEKVVSYCLIEFVF